MNKTNLQSIHPLTKEQINEFLTNGILVVDNVLTESELLDAQQGLNATLKKYGIDCNDLGTTGHNLKFLSSTSGSGGVLDIFHPHWKLKIAENLKLFSILSQLWQASCENHNIALPFGDFDCNKGYIYLDRIGYRIPTKLSDAIATIGMNEKKKKSLQRSLTPHLDCCPDTIVSNDYSKVTKWRPFQSFIALSDTLSPNQGGFEGVPGFHHNFNEWTKNRPHTILKNGTKPAPCLGEFTPIRPKEDSNVIQQIKHIPCKAGSLVIWDVRIPHANSLYNLSDQSRSVVYTSFLPCVEINKEYVLRQLELYKQKKKMTDQWSKNLDLGGEEEEDYDFSRVGRFFMGLDDWDALESDEIDRLYQLK